MRPALLFLLSCGIPACAYEVHLDFAWVSDMAVDPAGIVYLVGASLSGLPSKQIQILQKLDVTGTPLYTVKFGELTYRGPPPFTASGINVNGVALDKAGSLYITGFVNEPGLSTANAAQKVPGGMEDAFVAKLSADGTQITYFTYLGGSGVDRGKRIAVDANGNAYVTGNTCSTDFPTVNAAQTSFGGGPFPNFRCDAFAAKLDPSGSTLVYSTYLGGAREDDGLAIATDGAGNAYIAGATSSVDFPTYKPLQAEGTCTTYICSDAFLVKLDASGAIVYSTYLGGTGYEQANGVAADTDGNAYVTGATGSCDFPVVNAISDIAGDGHCQDAFLAKVSPEGQLTYSTYLGGDGYDHADAITIDADGNAYVTGGSASTDFPTNRPLQEPAWETGFITKLDPTGSTVAFSTRFGVPVEERNTAGFAIALDAGGSLYIGGARSGGAVDDDFVLKIDRSRTLPVLWQQAITAMKIAAGTDRLNFWQWAWYWQRSPAFLGAPVGFGVLGSIDDAVGMIDKIIAAGGGNGFQNVSAEQWVSYFRQVAVLY